jgi:beta-phosphoglucomutase-like phosphatase (HAD superfamily)
MDIPLGRSTLLGTRRLRPPEHVTTLLFDWDGTVADSTAANAAAFQAALQFHGGSVTTAWFETHAGLSTADAVEAAAAEQGLSIDTSAFAALRDREFLRRIGDVRPVAPVLALVRRSTGRRRMAVVSGNTRPMVTAMLGRLGLDGVFDTIVTREDAAAGKPDPALYRVALERLAVPAQLALAYEDTDEGLRAARAAGIAVVDVRGLPVAADTGQGTGVPVTAARTGSAGGLS